MRWAMLILATTLAWPIGCGNESDRPAPLGTGGSSGQNACWSKPSFDSCFYCCLSEHPDGAEVWFDALVVCACQPKYCATVCAATLCAQPTDFGSDAACDDCLLSQLDVGTECDIASEKACDADPECVAAFACQAGCRIP